MKLYPAPSPELEGVAVRLDVPPSGVAPCRADYSSHHWKIGTGISSPKAHSDFTRSELRRRNRLAFPRKWPDRSPSITPL